jgi:hypothetical protein
MQRDDDAPPPVIHALNCQCDPCRDARRDEARARREAEVEALRATLATLAPGSSERRTAISRIAALVQAASRTQAPPERQVWRDMLRRCENEGDRWYPSYGGRGIRVCDAWHDFASFYADMGPKPSPAHSIDRVDNDGDYEPGNCRWATAREQQENKSNARRYEWSGRRLTLKQWAREIGLSLATLRYRLDAGWPVARVLGEPLSRPFRAMTTDERERVRELVLGGMTQRAAAEAVGVSEMAVSRLVRGLSFDGVYARLGTPRPMPGSRAAIVARYGRRAS